MRCRYCGKRYSQDHKCTPTQDRYCRNCGSVLNLKRSDGLPTKQALCEKCNPYDPVNERIECQRRAVQMVNQYPQLVVIEKECPCLTDKKIRHHYDYSKPYSVYLLCQKCHMAEHVRINKEEKAIVLAAVIAKLGI